MPFLDIVAGAVALILALFLACIAGLICWRIYRGDINLRLLISEKNGDASMSRFQLLLFTFVISISLFLIVVQTGELPTVPPEILTLLGISGGTYVVSKGIQHSVKSAPETEQPDGSSKEGGGGDISSAEATDKPTSPKKR